MEILGGPAHCFFHSSFCLPLSLFSYFLGTSLIFPSLVNNHFKNDLWCISFLEVSSFISALLIIGLILSFFSHYGFRYFLRTLFYMYFIFYPQCLGWYSSFFLHLLHPVKSILFRLLLIHFVIFACELIFSGNSFFFVNSLLSKMGKCPYRVGISYGSAIYLSIYLSLCLSANAGMHSPDNRNEFCSLIHNFFSAAGGLGHKASFLARGSPTSSSSAFPGP